MRKYRPLGDYLVRQSEVEAPLTFREIEKICGFDLPPSAYSHRAWWANSISHPQACSWLNVGWRVGNVKVEEQTVSFMRPLILSINKAIDDGGELSLKVSLNSENLTLILAGPIATACTAYTWQHIVQMLINKNPHLFGYLTRQPMHHIFPEMLAKLGFTVVNRETGESWKRQRGKGTRTVPKSR
jgi:hypothetical protein